MKLLSDDLQNAAAGTNINLSSALNSLASLEKCLALEIAGSRYNIGVKYGLLRSQLALALSGKDRGHDSLGVTRTGGDRESCSIGGTTVNLQTPTDQQSAPENQPDFMKKSTDRDHLLKRWTPSAIRRWIQSAPI